MSEEFFFVFFVDFNNVKIGEWVLVVGNFFNLILMVIVGIVSVKVCDLNEFDSNL